ncbi:MAG: hypothetical protein Kow006_26520 [Gammaproteobacteria bacterium]
MKDFFELLSLVTVRKNELTQPGSIKTSLFVDHFTSKVVDDFRERRFSGFDDIVRNDIGVDDNNVVIVRENPGDSRFATCNATG